MSKNNITTPNLKTKNTDNEQSTVICVLGKVVVNTQAKDVKLKSVQVLLLIVYLTEVRKAVSRNDLAMLFWPEREQKDGLKLLSNLLSRVNKLLPNYLKSFTDSKGERYVSLADLDHVTESNFVDSLEFKKLIQQDDISILERASSLYKGEFLTGVEVKGNCQELEEWLEHSRLDYQACYIQLLYKLIDSATNNQQHEKALSHVQDLLVLKPFDNDLHQSALALYSKLDNKLGLVNHYSYLAQRIAEEFGTDVDTELTKHYQSLLKTFSYNTTNYKNTSSYENTGKTLVNYDAISTPYYENFVGRQEDLASLKELLRQERFVSIVGMAGIGKSTLLLELLQQFEREQVFEDGILVIPQELNKGFDLLDYLAIECGLSKNEASRQDLLDFLKDKRLLLAFDSTSVLQDEYHLLADLIHKTTFIKIVVTSLRPIGVSSEVIKYLKGVDFPVQQMNFENVLMTSTAKLFLQHAKKVVPNFSLRKESLKDFCELCYLSQGSPLIITIAASWIGVLSLNEITTSLLDLKHQHNDVDPRHKSVEAIFERLWELEQTLEQQHYSTNSINNAGIMVAEKDLESFTALTTNHPLYSLYCSRRLQN